MRILIIANNIEELGGAQRVVDTLATGLAGRGHDVTAVGIVPHPPAHAYAFDRRVTILDAPYPAGDRTALEQVATTRLQALLDAGEPGVVICAQLWAMEHLKRCRLDGWRVIGQYHSSYEAAANGRDLARASAYRDVDAFTLLTDADTAAFAAHGFCNVQTMPNALGFFPEDPAPLTEPVVTFLGRLSPEKGPRFLVEAWRRARLPGWRLQFIGSGPSREAIAAMTEDDPTISLCPPTDDPMGVLLGTGILALPSLTEGFPLALAEAMTCGVPCVASDCSAGVRELIDDGVTGLIARRGDAEHLAVQLRLLMEDAALRDRLGRAGRASVVRLLPETILDQWQVLLAEVMR